jgi:hypothetical protein
MSILLSDDGICKACPAVGMRTTKYKQLRCSPAKCLVHPDYKNMVKAAAIHAVQYLEEPCTEHKVDGADPWEHSLYEIGKHTYFSHRRECDDCMAEIHKELGI